MGPDPIPLAEFEKRLAAMSHADLVRILTGIAWDFFGNVDDNADDFIYPGRVPDKADLANAVAMVDAELFKPDAARAMRPMLPYGRSSSSDELIVPLPNGGTLRCGSGATYSWGGYLRICAPDDRELFYWDSTEWQSEDEGELVIGAVFASALSPMADLLEERADYLADQEDDDG